MYSMRKVKGSCQLTADDVSLILFFAPPVAEFAFPLPVIANLESALTRSINDFRESIIDSWLP